MPRYAIAVPMPTAVPPTVSIGSALGNMLAGYLQGREEKRQERNRMLLAGALPAGRGTTPPARADVAVSDADLSRAVGRIGTAAMQGVNDAERGALVAPLVGGRALHAPDVASRTALMPGEGQYRHLPVFDERPRPAAARMPSISQAIGQDLGFDEALSGGSTPVVLTGLGGERYVYDPMARMRQEQLFKDALEERAAQRQQARLAAEQERQVQALVAAGMPEAEARARVLTNTVRYDEVYGPQSRGLSLPEFEAREAIRFRYQAALAKLRAAQDAHDLAAYRRAQLELQAAAAELRALDVEASTLPRYSGTDRDVLRSTPKGQAELAAADSARADVARRAREIGARAQAATAPRAGDTSATPPRDPKIEAHVRALLRSGLSPEEVKKILRAEGYAVAGDSR